MLYGPRTELERYMAHFGVDEYIARMLMDSGIALPPRGTAGALIPVAQAIASPQMIKVDTALLGTVATVAAPAPVGSIWSWEFWNPDTGAFQSTPPTILVGQQAGVRVICYGSSAFDQNMQLEITVIAPDGSSIPIMQPTLLVQAGLTATWAYNWLCDQVGDYLVSLVLFAEYVG